MAVDETSNICSVYGLTGDTVGINVYSDFLPSCYSREYITV